MDDPEIEAAIAARRARLADASRQRADAQANRQAKIDAFRDHAEATITPSLRAVIEQVTKEPGISAEIESDLAHTTPWIAFKLRVPPRTAEVRFTYDLDQDEIAIRTTGEGEPSGPHVERRELSALTTDFVQAEVRNAFVHAAT